VALYPYRYDADSRASANGTGTIVWTKILGPDDFHIDANTGEITWAPIEPGDYVVGIAASDDVGATDQIWQIHVDATGDTTPPQIADFTHTITDEGGGLVTAELIATFNEGVQVRPVDVALLDSAGDPVTITSVSYEVATHELTIVAEHLTENSSYTLRLLDTITDDALNPLDGEFDGYTFPTGNGASGGDFGFDFAADLAVPTVETVAVNGGGDQRSVVNNLQVTFSEFVTVDAGAFEVIQRSTGLAVDVLFSSEDVLGKTIATLTFTGDLTEYGSLVDGNYLLTTRGDRVHDRQSGLDLDGDEDGLAGGNHEFGEEEIDGFFRFFGDQDGDRDVDNRDFLKFRGTFRRSDPDPAYLWYFDFDNDGDVDNRDFLKFRSRFRQELPFE